MIEFAAAQPAGSLTLRHGTGPRVSLAVFGAPGPAVALLPDTIRILNTDTVVASYRLSIPAGVSRVTVLLAGERRLRLDRSSLGAAGHKITLRP